MKLLLHTCCGPCTIYPVSVLRDYFEVTAHFFNPNIHPFQEYVKRRSTLLDFCNNADIKVVETGRYGLYEFLRKAVFHEQERCSMCYAWRMEETAQTAAKMGFSCFSTTLLYSRYQNHEKLKEFGCSLSEKYSVRFIYRDFRDGWQYGIDKSKEIGMYRQSYCGCIYSEQERYDKSLKYKNISTL